MHEKERCEEETRGLGAKLKHENKIRNLKKRNESKEKNEKDKMKRTR
jgi:hypothetical protein